MVVSRFPSFVGVAEAGFPIAKEIDDVRPKAASRAPRVSGRRQAGNPMSAPEQQGGPRVATKDYPPARRRQAKEQLRTRDLAVLAWCAEQYAVRIDQLEVLLVSGPRTVRRVTVRLREAGLIEVRKLLVGEPAWAIPTSRGLRTTGQGFGLWRPRVGLLAHVAAINDVRLHVQSRSPRSEWLPERFLAKERRHPKEHLPDGVVIADGRRVAIEVELTVKSRRRMGQILDELSGSYDTVLYWCAPGPYRQLSELAQSGRWPKLGVRELPHRELPHSQARTS